MYCEAETESKLGYMGNKTVETGRNQVEAFSTDNGNISTFLSPISMTMDIRVGVISVIAEREDQ